MTTRVAISLIKRNSSAEILQLRCHVRPGASKVREGVVTITDEAIELCVSAPTQDGKANKAVLQVLSEVSGYCCLSLPSPTTKPIFRRSPQLILPGVDCITN
ncbi:hypothetical protein HD806DRAFT_491073 [Xylariaceae sp. AK1471]|nr:hypothetical protein HD806DRAFT_491073 [Xylariaceae sp. AK1471]